ncbi:MAG: hypothetical protein U9N13_07760 [Euryarchaeota archaeon]|nr:hypothetical protein [Euryarchaeota archaeon]
MATALSDLAIYIGINRCGPMYHLATHFASVFLNSARSIGFGINPFV